MPPRSRWPVTATTLAATTLSGRRPVGKAHHRDSSRDAAAALPHWQCGRHRDCCGDAGGLGHPGPGGPEPPSPGRGRAAGPADGSCRLQLDSEVPRVGLARGKTTVTGGRHSLAGPAAGPGRAAGGGTPSEAALNFPAKTVTPVHILLIYAKYRPYIKCIFFAYFSYFLPSFCIFSISSLYFCKCFEYFMHNFSILCIFVAYSAYFVQIFVKFLLILHVGSYFFANLHMLCIFLHIFADSCIFVAYSCIFVANSCIFFAYSAFFFICFAYVWHIICCEKVIMPDTICTCWLAAI